MHLKMMDKSSDYQLSCLRSQLFANMYEPVVMSRMNSSKERWLEACKFHTIRERTDYYETGEGLDEVPIVTYPGSLDIGKYEEKVKEFRETVLKFMDEYDPTEEFGITADEYREIVVSLTDYLDNHEFEEGDFDYDLSPDGENVQEEQQYLNVLKNPDFEVIYELHGWQFVKEVIGKFTVPDDGKEYMLLFTVSKEKANLTAFANTALAVLLGQNVKTRAKTSESSQKLACNVTVSEDGQNHFWMLVSNK